LESAVVGGKKNATGGCLSRLRTMQQGVLSCVCVALLCLVFLYFALLYLGLHLYFVRSGSGVDIAWVVEAKPAT